jgi:Na+-driven multidrug efflux pump
MAAAAMLLFTILCQMLPAQLVSVFTDDPAVVAVGEEYLRIVSWNFVASGVVFVASSMFQAMGNTLPSLATSVVRITIVAVPSLMLSRMPGFQLNWIWYISVGSVVVQLVLSMWLLRREFGRRLTFDTVVA